MVLLRCGSIRRSVKTLVQVFLLRKLILEIDSFFLYSIVPDEPCTSSTNPRHFPNSSSYGHVLILSRPSTNSLSLQEGSR